ncbi:MAG: hypothetical protein CMQ39_04400 [Gammaproteobacteria bacterium]|nr:hypothetical protein [Gammaproteobacteria bacterium]|tara:strand:- start:3311 stop:4015 length:705 start_codon:yes stop_codon:yes gene_type:complete
MNPIIDRLFSAIKDRKPIPPFEETLNIADAYEVQKKVSEKIYSSELLGLKAGVTSKDMQNALGINTPLIGGLFKENQLDKNPKLPYRKGRLIECELGLFLDSHGDIQAICAAIEFAVLDFEQKTDLSGPNLVASNVAVERFLLGEKFNDVDLLSKERCSLFRDNVIVNSADIGESLGGPREAAKLIANEALRWSYRITEDCFFLSGACGSVIKAEPGEYRAEFGGLGELSFEII